MNIFFLSECPVIAAQYQTDIHVNKMVTETAQLLTNCYTLDDLNMAPYNMYDEPRRHSYPKHPCSIWAKTTLGNWKWLVKHGLALEDERLFRGYKPSISAEFIRWSINNPPNIAGEFTEPPLAMGDFIPTSSNYVDAYREYYRSTKKFNKNGKFMAKYSIREIPQVVWMDSFAEIRSYNIG